MLLFPGFKGLLQHSDVIFWTYQTDLVFLILVFSNLVIIPILLMKKYPTVFIICETANSHPFNMLLILIWRRYLKLSHSPSIFLSALKDVCHDWA